MKYVQYKGVVEREYNMSLKKIMQQICVTEEMNAAEGAKKLGIAKQVFVYWRQYFRLEERQIFFDQTVENLMQSKSRYSEEAECPSENAAAAAGSTAQHTLEDLEGAVDGLIKYYKYIHYSSEGFSLKTAKLPLFKFSKKVISDYKKGELSKEWQSEA